MRNIHKDEESEIKSTLNLEKFVAQKKGFNQLINIAQSQNKMKIYLYRNESHTAVDPNDRHINNLHTIQH